LSKPQASVDEKTFALPSGYPINAKGRTEGDRSEKKLRCFGEGPLEVHVADRITGSSVRFSCRLLGTLDPARIGAKVLDHGDWLDVVDLVEDDQALNLTDVGHRAQPVESLVIMPPRKSTAILWAPILSFFALPPWVAFMYNAWPRTKGMFCWLHRSVTQYQVKIHSTATAMSSRSAAIVMSNDSGTHGMFRCKTISPFWSIQRSSIWHANRSRSSIVLVSVQSHITYLL
jgi:hypothetical protein